MHSAGGVLGRRQCTHPGLSLRLPAGFAGGADIEYGLSAAAAAAAPFGLLLRSRGVITALPVLMDLVLLPTAATGAAATAADVVLPLLQDFLLNSGDSRPAAWARAAAALPGCDAAACGLCLRGAAPPGRPAARRNTSAVSPEQRSSNDTAAASSSSGIRSPAMPGDAASIRSPEPRRRSRNEGRSGEPATDTFMGMCCWTAA